eukprot:scaffold33347_cov51-Isochrysis_galbana.AAC.1
MFTHRGGGGVSHVAFDHEREEVLQAGELPLTRAQPRPGVSHIAAQGKTSTARPPASAAHCCSGLLRSGGLR